MLPMVDVGLMAILDTIQLLLAVISGSHTAPVLTTILVHFTIPLTTLFNKCSQSEPLCPRRRNIQTNDDDRPSPSPPTAPITSQHVFGSTLVLLSTVLALSPAVLTLIYPDYFPPKNIMANRTAWNTILFVLSTIPGALSQIYKHRAMATFAQPVDATLLNFTLSTFSLAFATVVSPLFYSLQGLADVTTEVLIGTDLKVRWWIHLYPSTDISKNTADGISCLLGTLDNAVQRNGYPESAHCDYSSGIVFFHVFSIVALHHAIHRICNAGAFKILHRGLSAGIILGVVVMIYYQIFVDNVDYGFLNISYDITCAVVLVMGSEVYHRVSFEEPSFETKYLEIGDGLDDFE